MDLEEIINRIEEFNESVLQINAKKLKEEWDDIGVPNIISENNPYKVLYRTSEGVKVGAVILMYINDLRRYYNDV